MRAAVLPPHTPCPPRPARTPDTPELPPHQLPPPLPAGLGVLGPAFDRMMKEKESRELVNSLIDNEIEGNPTLIFYTSQMDLSYARLVLGGKQRGLEGRALSFGPPLAQCAPPTLY